MIDRFETFTVLISKISRNIRKIKTEEMAEYNLRSVHVSCLYYLYKKANMTATELCDKCEEDKAAISRSLDYLEKNGYLIRKSETNKRYKSSLVLTDKGKEIGEIISLKIDHVLDEVSGNLTEAERESFYYCLSMISDNLSRLAGLYQ